MFDVGIHLKILECLLRASTGIQWLSYYSEQEDKQERKVYKGVCSILKGIFSLEHKTQNKKEEKSVEICKLLLFKIIVSKLNVVPPPPRPETHNNP